MVTTSSGYKNPRKRAFGVHKPPAVPNAGDSQAKLIIILLVIVTTALQLVFKAAVAECCKQGYNIADMEL